MIDNLIGFSIKNKFIIMFFTFALVGWGIYSLNNLPIDAVPDITNNQVQVITTVPTLAAQEVEKFITYPVETSMATIQDVSEIRSVSRFGLSVVTIVFEDDVDILTARQLVGERLLTAQKEIPAGLANPEMMPITTGLGEIYQYVLHTKPGYEKKYSAMELRTIQDWIVKRQLLGTPGVADVSSLGGYVKQYEVAINPGKLRSFNVTLSEIFDALSLNNQNTGGAYIDKMPNAYFIRGIGLVSSLEDIEKIVIKNTDGLPLLIRDVAEVKFGSAVRYGAMTRNTDGEVVGALVLMLKGENSNQVIKNVKERIQQIEKSLPEGVVIEPFLDRSDLVGRAIFTVSKNLIEGGLIVIFILVLLLGNFRAGLVVASVIPLSMLFAISMMNLFGVSGNLMSLGAIDFGLIVDGAVIIVEAIVLRVSTVKGLSGNHLTQQQMDEEVLHASIKIRHSASFGEIIILIVYLPILALSGIEGKMFKPMAETVSFAIIGALILSLTYVPMMSALFLSKKTVHKKNISDKIMDACHNFYHPILLFALRTKQLIVVMSIVLFIVSLFIFSRMGGEFIPTLDEGDFAVEVRLMGGSSLSQTISTTNQASAILLKFPEVKQVVGKIGSSEIPTDPMPVEACDLMVILKDKDEWTSAEGREELAEKMSQALSVIPGVKFSFQQPIQMRFNELMTGARQDIAIKIFGEDLDVLASKANEVSEIIKNTEGIGDMFVEQVSGLPQIMVEYNRSKLAQYGLSVSSINTVLRTAFAGESAGVVFEGEKRFDLVVRLKEDFRKNIEDVRAIYVPLPHGGQIPISEVASIQFKEGPMQISREETKRRITVGINARDRDVASLVEEIKIKLDGKLNLPPGYHVSYGGQFENFEDAKRRLSFAVPVALLFIFILLYFTFGSFKESMLILTTIPLAAIGGVFALLIRGMPFSISAGIGFIALFGVAVLNGIVLIAYFNQLKKEGIADVKERVLKGAEVRLRPVLITASVASLGFLPMALSNSSGAEVQKPLATVVIGGLVTSTILTLIVLPVLYTYMERIKIKKFGGISSVIILMISIIGFSPANAQDTVVYKYLTAEEAVKLGLENSPMIKANELEIENQKVLKATSFDLAKTVVGTSYGQYNSALNDNSVNISQDIAFPTVYTSASSLAKQKILSSERQLAVSQNEVAKTIRLLYFEAALNKEKIKLLKYQDSLYNNFKKAAELRFKTGETAYLETLAAETRLMEIDNEIFQVQSDMQINTGQLQRLLNLKESIAIPDSVVWYTWSVSSDTVLLNQNPYLLLLKQQTFIQEATTKLEKAKLLPDFSIGVTSQTLKGFQNVSGVEQYYGGSKRFEFITAGIGVPLWYAPHKARVQSSKIEQQIAESNYVSEKMKMENQLLQLYQQHLKYNNVVRYYNQKALPQSDLMIQFASKSYRAGESGYLEYIENITSALRIKLNYLETVSRSNEINIYLEYLLGGKP